MEIASQLTNAMTGVTVTYASATNSFTFVLSNTSSQLTLLSSSTCLPLLGFPSGASVSSTAGILVSSQAVNVLPIGCVCVHTGFKSRSFLSLARNKNVDRTLLATVPVDVPRNGMIVWRGPPQFRGVNLFTNQLTSIEIKLRDMNGVSLDLRGAPWNMTLQLEIVRFTS
jgi:hypothetical protein